MITYLQSIYNYNSYTKEFTRYGKTEWHILATHKGIAVNGRYMKILPDPKYEFTYKLRREGIYSTETPKGLVDDIFVKWACKGFGEAFADSICSWVYEHGMEIPFLKEDKKLFLCATNTDRKKFICTQEQAFSLFRSWHHEYMHTGYNRPKDDVQYTDKQKKFHFIAFYEKDNEMYTITIKEL